MDDFHKKTTLPDLHLEAYRLPLPKQIGPYKIDSLLKKGGMSVVFLGVHPETAEPIVVKILPPKYCKNKEMVQRFLKEAEIIEMAQHPNIVRLFSHGEWEKGLYIGMEWIQGVSLRQFIQQKSLNLNRALEIILQVAYALCHLHTHGVIHRDLKPENILMTENGEIKVIDFGIAHTQESMEEERITQKKRMMGTPIYMSPEQKENPSFASYASDIYSLGIIAYELILGRLSHGVIHLDLLPKHLKQIIEKALQPELKDRYQDIVDFITDISGYKQRLGENPKEEAEEPSDQIISMVDKARQVLIPQTPPQWGQLEIGMAIQEGASLSDLYLDFFHLPKNRYGIVLVESIATEPPALFQLSTLSGMIKMALNQDVQPVHLLNSLNQMVHKEGLQGRFGGCFLLLDPEKGQLSYSSCQYTELQHLPAESKTVRTLATPNPALGLSQQESLLETTDNWEPESILLLHSLGIQPQILEHQLLSPQAQAEKILESFTAKQKPLKRALAVLSIRRLF
jgi:serine/threonine protein kinase